MVLYSVYYHMLLTVACIALHTVSLWIQFAHCIGECHTPLLRMNGSAIAGMQILPRNHSFEESDLILRIESADSKFSACTD